MPAAFPTSASDLTLDRLTDLIRTVSPDAEVESFDVTGARTYGDGSNQVSTAGRIELQVKLTGQAAKNVVIKVARTDIFAQHIYRNEVNFYTRIRPSLDIEAPRPLGGQFDEESGTFGLALEDLRVEGVRFPSVKTDVSLQQMRGLLDTLAVLHATFWQSEKLLNEYSFMAPHTSGDLYRLFHDPKLVPGLVASEIENEQFKREMLADSGTSLERMYADYRKLQFHQATLPFTLCHGDTHIGNTYLTKDDRGGLIDWQLSARGYFMHDVSYVLITGLSVGSRRENEKALIGYYLEQLRLNGVSAPPGFEEAWLEYRRAATWCLYIGWLTTPVANYGWDITVCNLVRLFSAYNDLESAQALKDLPEAPPFE